MALLQLIITKIKSLRITKLYDYQQVAFDKVIFALMNNSRALMVMATGLGKTIVAAKIMDYFFKPGDTVLILCHDTGILNNVYNKFQMILGAKATYAKFYGIEKDWEANKHNFVFATFQSLHAHIYGGKKKNIFSRKHFKYIIVDESHHSGAENFNEVIKYFTPQWILGMTATVDREDEKNIRDTFGIEVVNYSLAEAIAKGWLTEVDYRVMSDGLNSEILQSICNQMRHEGVRLSEDQINKKIFVKMRTEEQCKIISKYSKKGKKAIIFCESIKHLQHVASILPSCVVLHSKQNSLVNDANFKKFTSGKVRHALVVDKFNEGIDVPDTDLIVFLRATKSLRIFLQQLGRGLRKAFGKKKVTILDFVGNIQRIKQVQALVGEIEQISVRSKKKRGFIQLDSPLHVEGKGFQFDFDSQIVNVLSAFEKVSVPYYSKWKEASRVARKLGIKNSRSFFKEYKKDFRLPLYPNHFYADFPGWPIFLGTGTGEERYKTWEESSRAIKKLKITGITEYKKRYKEDPRLYRNPDKMYSNFPGFPLFLGTGVSIERYVNWRQAQKAVRKLKIKSLPEYYKRYKEDPKLYRNPGSEYSDFPGWRKFLGKK